MTERSLAEELMICTRRCREMDAPLAKRLSVMADDVRRLAPQFAAIVDRMVDRLQLNEAGGSAPEIGDPMPAFVLPDESGHLVSLDALRRNGMVVVAFLRGHWCPYCQITADALARVEPEVRRRGGQLVIVTPEVQAFSKVLKSDSGAQCPILTDLDNGYALGLGLAIKIDDEKQTGMTAAGWDIAPFQCNDNWILPIPAIFVIDRAGIVRGRFVDPDYRRRMEIDDLLAALDTAQVAAPGET